MGVPAWKSLLVLLVENSNWLETRKNGRFTRFDMKLMLSTIRRTLSWWRRLLRTEPQRHPVWHVLIPGFFWLRHRRRSAFWYRLRIWDLKIVKSQAISFYGMRFM